MVVSRQLLAFMSMSPSSAKPALVSFQMDFSYPFPWTSVSGFVISQKRKGPPDEAVTLEVEGNIYRYTVEMPWYARILLKKSVQWEDIQDIDSVRQVLSERGTNTSHTNMGRVFDHSVWSASPTSPSTTNYSKRVEAYLSVPIVPSLALKVAQPLIKWFKAKSTLCREMEVEAVQNFIAEGGLENNSNQ